MPTFVLIRTCCSFETWYVIKWIKLRIIIPRLYNKLQKIKRKGLCEPKSFYIFTRKLPSSQLFLSFSYWVDIFFLIKSSPNVSLGVSLFTASWILGPSLQARAWALSLALSKCTRKRNFIRTRNISLLWTWKWKLTCTTVTKIKIFSLEPSW